MKQPFPEVKHNGSPTASLTHQIPLVTSPPRAFQKSNESPFNFTNSSRTDNDNRGRRSQSFHKSINNEFNPFQSNDSSFKLNSVNCFDQPIRSSMKPQGKFERKASASAQLDNDNGLNTKRPRKSVSFNDQPDIKVVENWKLQNLSSEKRLLKLQQEQDGCIIF